VRLVFDDLALADLETIHNWIAKDNPKAAFAIIERLFASIEHLARFPHMGHIGRDERTFEWVVPQLPYIVVYEVRVERDEIVIAAVVHGARERGGQSE
jgi:plasmid stabilization system protein ParE